jgi:cytochrome c-type biogenesis protein CcmH/NrfF
VVFIGALIVALTVRRSGRADATADSLSDDDRKRAARLLNDRDPNHHSS